MHTDIWHHTDNIGLLAMREGSTAMLMIPSDLGFGAWGAPQAGVPGGATLIIRVELVKVLEGGFAVYHRRQWDERAPLLPLHIDFGK